MPAFIKGYLHTIEDAYLIIHAARFGLIKTIKKRLSPEDKMNLQSGMIFIFYEQEGGMKRWTDGLFWSPSRVKGAFLDYEEISNPDLKKFYTTTRGTSLCHLERESNRHKVLRKKTIAMRYGELNYHIISYYKEGINHGKIADYIFFRHIQEALQKDPTLLSDLTVKEEFKFKDAAMKKYNLIKATKETMKPNIDYRRMEKIACEVLLDLSRKKHKNTIKIKKLGSIETKVEKNDNENS